MIYNYFLASVIAFSGLFMGLLLAHIAKEELKQGKKYFVILQKIILILIMIFLNTKYYILIIASILLIFILKNYLKKQIPEIPLYYLIFGIIFFFASRNPAILAIQSSLVFLYGLPTGTLYYKRKLTMSIMEILKNTTFFIPIIALFLLKQLLYL